MGALTIRNLDPDVKAGLVDMAKRNNRSMEAQIRVILTRAVSPYSDPLEVRSSDPAVGGEVASTNHERWDPAGSERFGSYLIRRLNGLGGELELPPRTEMPRIVSFE